MRYKSPVEYEQLGLLKQLKRSLIPNKTYYKNVLIFMKHIKSHSTFPSVKSAAAEDEYEKARNYNFIEVINIIDYPGPCIQWRLFLTEPSP